MRKWDVWPLSCASKEISVFLLSVDDVRLSAMLSNRRRFTSTSVLSIGTSSKTLKNFENLNSHDELCNCSLTQFYFRSVWFIESYASVTTSKYWASASCTDWCYQCGSHFLLETMVLPQRSLGYKLDFKKERFRNPPVHKSFSSFSWSVIYIISFCFKHNCVT